MTRKWHDIAQYARRLRGGGWWVIFVKIVKYIQSFVKKIYLRKSERSKGKNFCRKKYCKGEIPSFFPTFESSRWTQTLWIPHWSYLFKSWWVWSEKGILGVSKNIHHFVKWSEFWPCGSRTKRRRKFLQNETFKAEISSQIHKFFSISKKLN